MRRRSDCADADAHLGGDLLVRHVQVEAKNEDLALATRQLANRRHGGDPFLLMEHGRLAAQLLGLPGRDGLVSGYLRSHPAQRRAARVMTDDLT